LNHRLLALALGTFAIGTGSFVFAGLLEGVAGDLSVSVATAGHLVTVFAVTYAVSSPVLATLTGSVGRKRLLVAAMALFVAGNLASVISPSFEILLASRVVAAAGAAVFTPTAAAVASSIAPPEARGRALSVVTGGLTVAFVAGIPLGSLIGTYSSWRMTFVMVGVLGIVAACGVRFLLPDVENPPVVSLRERVDTLRQPAVVAALVFTFVALMGGFVVFTYISPLLAQITGFGGAGVSGMLLVFGCAALVGNTVGGYGADHVGYGRLMAAIVVALTLSLLAFSLLVRISGSAPALLGVSAALVGWGIAGFALNPLQQYRVVQLAGCTRNVALSLNASAIYLGQGAGAFLGAFALDLGTIGSLGWTGALCTLLSLAVLLAGTRAKGPKVAPEA
jgi:DHA1 family inner membrane transport protein